MSVTKDTDILLCPVVSEKSREAGGKENVYTFTVHGRATKGSVKSAVEERYPVQVEDIRIINTPHRVSRFRGRRGTARSVKKAMVKIKEGQTIDIFQV